MLRLSLKASARLRQHSSLKTKLLCAAGKDQKRPEKGTGSCKGPQVMLAGDSQATLQQVLRYVAIAGRTTGRSQGERPVLCQLILFKAFMPSISSASEETEDKLVIPYNTLPVL